MKIQKNIFIFLAVIFFLIAIFAWRQSKKQSFFIEPTQEKVNLKLKQLKEAGEIKHPLPEDTFCDVFMEADTQSINIRSSCVDTKENVLNLILKFAFRGELGDLKSPFDEKASLKEMVEKVTQNFIFLKDADETKSLVIPRLNSNPPKDVNASVTLIPNLDEIKKLLVNDQEIEQVKTDYNITYYYPEETADVYKLEWNPYVLGFNLVGNLNLEIEVKGKILETKSTVGSIEKVSDNKIKLEGRITEEENFFQLSWQKYE